MVNWQRIVFVFFLSPIFSGGSGAHQSSRPDDQASRECHGTNQAWERRPDQHSGTPMTWEPLLVSYPYKPPIRIPKDMGMAWEYYGNLTRRGPKSLGVPGITLDIGMRLVIFSFPLAGCNATDSIYCSVRMTGENDSSCYFMDPLAEKVNAIAGVSGFGENGRFFFVEDFKNFWHPRTKRVSRKTSWSFGMEELWKVSLPSD